MHICLFIINNLLKAYNQNKKIVKKKVIVLSFSRQIGLYFCNYLKNKNIKLKQNQRLRFHIGTSEVIGRINICEKNNTKVILSTFCHYLHEKIKNDDLHILYKKIVLEENEIMKKLAKKNNLKLVDSSSLIPKEDSNFVDSNHFTPKGMNLLAKGISEAIKII